MRQQPILTWLVPAIIILTVIASGVGLFSKGGSGPFPFTTVHDETVQMYGQGLYAHDTVFAASTTQGTDIITLFLGVPLLAISFALTRRGSLRGGLMLSGDLAYLLYYGASLGLDRAYNNLFLVSLKDILLSGTPQDAGDLGAILAREQIKAEGNTFVRGPIMAADLDNASPFVTETSVEGTFDVEYNGGFETKFPVFNPDDFKFKFDPVFSGYEER